MTLVQKIKALAISRGMTIGLVEASLGFSMGLIGKWDKNTPGSDKILKVADFFGTTTDYLLRDELESPVDQSELKSLPANYYHLLNGAKKLELSKTDIDFLLDVAKSYQRMGVPEAAASAEAAEDAEFTLPGEEGAASGETTAAAGAAGSAGEAAGTAASGIEPIAAPVIEAVAE